MTGRDRISELPEDLLTEILSCLPTKQSVSFHPKKVATFLSYSHTLEATIRRRIISTMSSVSVSPMTGRDRISELPEDLLTEILSYLPTKQSARTSVLSKRWKNLWLNVPGLDLDYHVPYGADDERLLSFIDKFLEFSPELSLQKVKVKCQRHTIDGIMDRIGTAINRGTQHLDVKSSTHYVAENTFAYPCVEFMPENLFTSKTLVSLKLTSSGLQDPGFIFMPCLKFMHLVEVVWRVHLEKLISGCPVLEELTLVRDLGDNYAQVDDEFAVMRVTSRSLKRFHVPVRHEEFCISRVKCTLEVDAPGLEHMSLGEDHFDSIVVKNLTSLSVIDLDIKFVVKFGVFFDLDDSSKRNEIRYFLTGISSVRHMIISKKTVKALDLYSILGLIPKFNNLSRLEAVFPSESLQFLPAFLDCCPNLKRLVLKVVHSREMEEGFELTSVPQCLLSTLECVEIKRIKEWEEEEMKVASYFLENTAVLKKLTLSLADYPRYFSDSEILEMVNKFTIRSPSCRVILD